MKATETILRATVNKTLARKSGRVFEKLGITTDSAINMFLAQVIEQNGIPFKVVLGVNDDGTFWSDKIRQDSLAELYGN